MLHPYLRCIGGQRDLTEGATPDALLNTVLNVGGKAGCRDDASVSSEELREPLLSRLIFDQLATFVTIG